MAHELEIINGKAQHFFVGDTPWHGLGQRLINPPTVREGIIAAGLDWNVNLKPVLTSDMRIIQDYRAVVRDNDQKVLAVVGSKYHPLQNEDAFNWFQPFLDEGMAELHTAGSLSGGSKIWVLAKIKGAPMEILRNDPIDRFVLLSNSHDGSSRVKLGFTPIRVVCQNTLSMAHLNADSKLMRVSHTQSLKMNMMNLRNVMDVANNEFTATALELKKLTRKGINRKDLEKYIRRVFEMREVPATKGHGKATILNAVVELFEDGRGTDIPGVRGTVWAAYNAVTEFMSYKQGTSNETRMERLWFGKAKVINHTALVEALKLAA